MAAWKFLVLALIAIFLKRGVWCHPLFCQFQHRQKKISTRVVSIKEILVYSPEQVHAKEDVNLTGTVITFNKEFLTMGQNQGLDRLPLICNRQNAHELKISATEKAELESILEKCVNEFQQDADLQTEMLFSYVSVLLIFLSRIYNDQYNEKEPNQQRVLYRRFQACLEENYKKTHEARDYCGMLRISISHLNALIKEQSGKTITTHVHERLILETC